MNADKPQEEKVMKKTLLLGLFLILGTFVLFAQSGPVVAINNQTGYPIYYIYISESGQDDWEEDILTTDVLMPNQSVNCRLPSRGTWDFMAVDADGDEYVVYGIEIPPVNRINIK